MDWLHRRRHARTGSAVRDEVERPAERGTLRSAPGVAALFDGLRLDGRHAVLDFGAAAEAHLELYARFARQIRFADMLVRPPGGVELTEALDALAPPSQHLYDVVMAWNLLDRLWPIDRPRLIGQLARLTGPGARLYTVVDASGADSAPPFRYTLTGVDQVRQEAAGPPERLLPRLLPAQLEKVLAPFEVTRAFTLRGGLREYVAVKRT